jgi:aminopeptidase N
MRFLIFLLFLSAVTYSQMPAIEPGVSQELARWRATRYSDVRYKLNLTLEKMSPVLKGTMEIRVKLGPQAASPATSASAGEIPAIILDWRKIAGHEKDSTVTNITLNEIPLFNGDQQPEGIRASPAFKYHEQNDHLILPDAVKAGENVIKLDFTSPILTSGSAITRYVDKEDGSEYIYSLFVPSDASTAFPVFDQPDLKARFTLQLSVPTSWSYPITNTGMTQVPLLGQCAGQLLNPPRDCPRVYVFEETKPISTYVFAFAAGPFTKFPNSGSGSYQTSDGGTYISKEFIEKLPLSHTDEALNKAKNPPADVGGSDLSSSIYVRKSQAAKFKPHADEVFRLNREAVKYFEEYFNYKYPFPKYDLVLIPEFPFGGMEHAGATFLRESSVIFPQEPTKNDLVNRATLIFHETAHQWFGDTVTMRWFDDLWLKEGFATFMGYKALEKIMPEMNAWKVFYERIKQGAYQTDSTKGTTAIYQPIANLSAAKSAYGNIVYNKAPAFLRQAEFYLGEDKFQTAVRAFLKKHEYANAGWEDLVKEFEAASGQDLKNWANVWVKQPGLPKYKAYGEISDMDPNELGISLMQRIPSESSKYWMQKTRSLILGNNGSTPRELRVLAPESFSGHFTIMKSDLFAFSNYQDYGYGIFLLDDKSRDYVLKNIQNEKDPFLRSMMWGALWDSVREGELDPREYVELVVKVLQKPDRKGGLNNQRPDLALPNGQASAAADESTVALLLNRVGTAMNYYLNAGVKSGGKPAFPTASGGGDVGIRLENVLIERMQNAPTLGQRITFYRAFLNVAESENARNVLKAMLNGGNPSSSVGAPLQKDVTVPPGTLPTGRVSASGGENARIPIKTKDRFDIVTRLLILNDPDAPKLLAELEKTETSDDAKRYAYAAKAGIPTAENKAKYWNDFVNNKEISESWIEAAMGPWNSIRHSELTLPYLQKALQELPNHKRNRKIFFVNGWLGAFIGGQRSEEALAIVNKFLADNPQLDNDLRLKILENVDLIERAVKIRNKYKN